MKGKLLAAMVTALLVASFALPIMSEAQLNPYVLPSITLNPTSGPLLTPITITGTGFSPGVVVSIDITGGIYCMNSGCQATASSSGGFSVQVAPNNGAGQVTVTAAGSDGGQDHASAIFTITNANQFTQTTTTVTSTGQTVTVDDAGTTGVTATISGLPVGTGGVAISTTSLTSPSSGISAPSNAPTGTVYVDVHISLPSGVTATGTANICISSSSTNSGWKLQYYSNGQWNDATGLTFPSGKICGNIPVSALTGTNIAAIPGSATNYTYIYLGAFVVVLVIIIAAGILLSRRRPAPAATK